MARYIMYVSYHKMDLEKLTLSLTPHELTAEMPPKMLVGRQYCLHKAWVGRHKSE